MDAKDCFARLYFCLFPSIILLVLQYVNQFCCFRKQYSSRTYSCLPFFCFCSSLFLKGYDNSAVPWIVFETILFGAGSVCLFQLLFDLIISFFYCTLYLLISLYFWLLPTSLLVSTYGSYRASSDVKITVSFLHVHEWLWWYSFPASI